MISLEKRMILTPLLKLHNNEGDLRKIIVATGFECLPKKQKIAKSGHTVPILKMAKLIEIFCNETVKRPKITHSR